MPKSFNLVQKKIKICAEKLQNSVEKIQKTDRADWILSKHIYDMSIMFIALTKIP